MQENCSLGVGLIVLWSALAVITQSQSCGRQRCCTLSTCTSSYCTSSGSETWISTQGYDKYQYTKLVMVNNQCRPCQYNCKRCSSEAICTECFDGFYLGSAGCLPCEYKCLRCQMVNSLSKCSACDEGAYLDTNTLSCKNCPVGAKSCVDQTAIVECLAGYVKSSNSLFCTPCPSNCLSCPSSSSTCSVCQSGYFLRLGACSKCNITNCATCTFVSGNVLCSTCVAGFFRASSTLCSACPLNCRTCTSASVCTVCRTGYFVQSGGCSLASPVANCDTYTSTVANGSNTCSSCLAGFYLSSVDNQCLPCSITCTSCFGNHFGRCTACAASSRLFNQMCLPYSYTSSTKMQLYYTPASRNAQMVGGVLTCGSLLSSGTTISLVLSNLAAFRITVSFRIFTSAPGQAYSISLNSTTTTVNSLMNATDYEVSSQQSSSVGYRICAASNSTLYSHIGAATFNLIKATNTLTLTSLSSLLPLYIAQILVTASKCSSLCLECSETQCFSCLATNLFMQDAYCVYACASDYYTYSRQRRCVRECPTQTYALLSNASCMACVAPCLTCLNDAYCLSCMDGYFLSTLTHTCLQACPSRYFASTSTQNCESCVGRCNECINDQSCLSCQVGFLNSTSCLDICGDGYFEDLITLRCQICSPLCLTCQYEASHCSSCPSGTLFHQNSCLLSCPPTFYSSSSACLSCAYPCSLCANSSSSCLSCVEGYLVNSTCVSTCPAGYYQDNIQLQCVTCAPQCSRCSAAAQVCLACAPGHYLLGSSCYLTCPDTFYGETVGGVQVCSKCSGTCNFCLNLTYCLSCSSNFLADNGSGLCLRWSQCSQSYFANIDTLRCQACSPACLTCLYTASTCTSCVTGSVLHETSCVSSCPSQYFYVAVNTTNNLSQCTMCIQPCLTCLNATQCLSCVQGYKYSSVGHICSSTCSIGSFFNSSLNDCQPCSTNCLTCDNSKFCFICQANYFLNVLSTVENECVAACPDRYYADGGTCLRCLFPCLSCSSSIDCLSCQNGVLYQKRCLSGCPQSTYMNSTSGICNNCTGQCLTCKDLPTKCTLCLASLYLVQDLFTCVVSCPDGRYPFQLTKSCIKCPSTCSKCVNASYCTACIPNKTYLSLSTNICSESCPSGLYTDNSSGSCQPCSSKCLTCAGSATQCLICNTGFLLVRLANATYDCLTSCPSLFYSDNGACFSCVFPCRTCLSASRCVTCAPGTYLHVVSQSCLMSCPLGTYYSNSSTCANCTSPCLTCTNSTNCISCTTGYLLFQGSCVQNCPTRFYADASGICNRCSGLCATCSGKYTCLTCLTGFSFSGYCYSSCPSGTYASEATKKCETCTSPCMQCTSTSTYCKRCQFNMFAYRGKCSASCPVGTYESSEVCLTCQFPCVRCRNAFTCDECIGGYLLYMNTSCIVNVDRCPNDLYKMDSKYCVPSTWCPDGYYRDEEVKTCSRTCSRGKYINLEQKACLDSCQTGQYVGKSMTCVKWSQEPALSLMTMSAITFIRSSQIYLALTFNQSFTWNENNDKMYTVSSNSQLARRMLSTSNTITYTQEELTLLSLQIGEMPYQVSLGLPAQYISSAVTGYNLQNPSIKVKLPEFTAYTYDAAYSASIMRQFSEGMSWFIILFSMFFLIVNRVSDTYLLWDTAQLLYLLTYLDIQYSPNLQEFFAGMSNIHFLFVPSMFAAVVPQARLVSSPPFYAYAYDCSFLRTAGSPLLLITIIVGIFLILKLCELLAKHSEKVKQKIDQYPQVKSYIFKGVMRFRWHHTSDVFFLSYDIVVLFAVAEIANLSYNPNNVGSNVACFFLLLTYLAFPCFVSYKLYRHYHNIEKGKMVANLQCFYRGIEKTNKFGVSLILIRYFRKITYCAIIGVFTRQPMFALPILMFTSVLMGLFIFINKPFKKRLSNIVSVLTEAILVLMYVLIAVVQFGKDSLSMEAKIIVGWVSCAMLILLLLVLIFEIFCKTMFYLEPEKQKKVQGKQENEPNQHLSEEFLRQKAGEFFDRIFPRLRNKLNFDDDSSEALNDYEEGDSQNSENNQGRQKFWGLDNESEEKKSDQFRHYAADSEDATTQKLKDKKPPNYLIRCVKQI